MILFTRNLLTFNCSVKRKNLLLLRGAIQEIKDFYATSCQSQLIKNL